MSRSLRKRCLSQNERASGSRRRQWTERTREDPARPPAEPDATAATLGADSFASVGKLSWLSSLSSKAYLSNRRACYSGGIVLQSDQGVTTMTRRGYPAGGCSVMAQACLPSDKASTGVNPGLISG